MAEGDADVMRIEDFKRDLDAIVEQLEHWRVRKAVPDAREPELAELEKLLGLAQSLAVAFVEWECRRQTSERRMADFFDTMSSSTATLLEAINNNMTATNAVLVASEELDRVLEEGIWLKEQLTGVGGTEGSGPMFKDAVRPNIPSGLDVLAGTVKSRSKSAGGGRQ